MDEPAVLLKMSLQRRVCGLIAFVTSLFSTLLAGAGVRGGTIYGSSDKDGNSVADKQTSIQDFHSTVGHAMGMDVDHVTMSPSNRPFTVGDKGKIIADVLA